MTIVSTDRVAPDLVSGPLLAVEELTVEFATRSGWLRVVDGVSFTVGAGEIAGLVGESGSGKSVTSLALMRLLPTRSSRIGGSVRLGDDDLAAFSARQIRDVRGRDLAMIFQEPMTSLNPAFRIGDQIAEQVRRHRGVSRRSAMRRAVEVLEHVGIANAARRSRAYPHEFSGGMRQRAMIAMAISCDPKLLIADEPTTALDVTIQAQVLDLMKDLRQELGMAMLLITHDLGVVADACDAVHVMYGGHLVESASADELFAAPKHPYTEGLLRAMPQVDVGRQTLSVIPGQPPSPGALPSGCVFHPRCGYATDRCRAQRPDLVEVGVGHDSRCLRVGEISLEGV